jgi:hypothetical protein
MEVVHAYILRFAHSRSTPTFLVILASTHGDGVVRLTEHNILFHFIILRLQQQRLNEALYTKRGLIQLLAGLLALCISSDMTYWRCRIQIERLRCRRVVRGGNFQQKYKALFGLLEFMTLVTAMLLYFRRAFQIHMRDLPMADLNYPYRQA